MKKRIVEVILDLHKRAGAEVFSISLAKELTKYYEVFFISLYSDPDRSLETELNNAGINVYFCDKKAGLDLKCVTKYKKIIKKIKPDIIHFHRSCLPTHFLAFPFGIKKVKLCQTIHNIANKDGNRFSLFIRKIFVLRKKITLIAISDRIFKSMQDLYPSIDKHVIYNGIDFKKQKVNKIESSTMRFLCVARFSEQKNHALLFKSFEQVYLKNKNCTLTCVGDGELLDRSKKQSATLSSAGSIFFPGSTDDVSYYYNNADVFVLSSLYEGNPITILEAMSYGLVIIAPNVGGVPDIITKRNGFIFEKNNQQQLTDFMNLCCKKEIDFNTYFENNLKDSKKYNIESCAESYFKLFERI